VNKTALYKWLVKIPAMALLWFFVLTLWAYMIFYSIATTRSLTIECVNQGYTGSDTLPCILEKKMGNH
jgi:hypothetical protein